MSPPPGGSVAASPRSRKRFELRTTDFDELAQAIVIWDAAFHQMGGGRFVGSLTGVQAGGLTLFRISLSHSIQARGVLRQPGYVFTPVLGHSTRAVWRGRELREGQINVLSATTQMDHLSPPGADYLNTVIDRDRLHEVAAIRFGMDLEEYLGGQTGFTPTRGLFARFVDRTRRLLARETLLSPVQLQTAEDEITGLLVEAIISGDAALEATRSPPGRMRAARLAEEFMLANLTRPVTMLELCREVGVSERTLQYAFADRFGMNPKAYLKAHRLNAVRRQLTATDPTPGLVTRLAAEWGFSHLGEFAAAYKNLFGELPSETVSRRRTTSTRR